MKFVIENPILHFITAVTETFHTSFNNQNLINKINSYQGASSLTLLEKTGTMNMPTLNIPASNTSAFIDIYFYSIVISEY